MLPKWHFVYQETRHTSDMKGRGIKYVFVKKPKAQWYLITIYLPVIFLTCLPKGKKGKHKCWPLPDSP